MIEYDGKEAEEISSLLYSVQNEQGTSHLFGTDKCLELTQEIIKIINESNRLEKLGYKEPVSQPGAVADVNKILLDAMNDFTEHIIHGVGGLDDYETYELPVCADEKLFIAGWVIRCLANVDCKGSELVVSEIIKKRNADKNKKQAAASL